MTRETYWKIGNKWEKVEVEKGGVDIFNIPERKHRRWGIFGIDLYSK